MTPYALFGRSIVGLELKTGGPNVVQCSANDPAAGLATYLALIPAVALTHGCQGAGGPVPQSDAAVERVCLAEYPPPTSPPAHLANGDFIVNRTVSLAEVCEGFGLGGRSMTVDLSCAAIAAAGAVAEAPVGRTLDDFCTSDGVVQAFMTGRWASVACGTAAGVLGDALVAASVAGAPETLGVSAVVGPVAASALSSGLQLACSGRFFAGGLGQTIEGNREASVARQVVNDGKCIAHRINSTFDAVNCPS